MKKYVCFLLSLLVTPVFFTSCLNDEEYEYDDYCYISGFTLGSLRRTLFTYSIDGEDSVYSTTFAGNLFPMTIDQRALTIENMDSLPLRTDLSAVLTTATYEGVLAWRKASLAEDDDSLWTAYSSSDSLDLREPLHFACIASDGLSYRTYTLTVNVHQQNADSTVWNEVGEAEALDEVGNRKVICWNDMIMVLGEESDGTLLCIQHPMETSGDWIVYSTSGTEGADVATLQRQDAALFLSNADGQIIKSSNALDWVVSDYPAQDGLQLVGASGARLYALLGGKLVSSGGGEWEEEPLDDDEEYLPCKQVYSFAYELPDGRNRMMMVGARDNDSDASCMVWAKTWKSDAEEAEATWMFYVPNETDKRRCPVMENLNVVEYDDGFLAFGGGSRDGMYAAMDSVLYSQDHGITWKPYDNDDMIVDPLIQEVAQDAKYIVSAVDSDKYLWVMLDKYVWRGRINRLGFLRQDP